MSGGDVQDFAGLGFHCAGESRDELRRGYRQRRHRARKVHPNLFMRLGVVSGLAGRAAFSHGLRQRAKIPAAPGAGKEINHHRETRGRAAVQKGRGFLRQ